MEVVNLGQFQRQPTLAENLREAIKEGVATGTSIADVQAKNRALALAQAKEKREASFAEAQEARAQSEEQRKVEEAKRIASKFEYEQKKAGLELADIHLDNVSRKVATMDKSMQEIFFNSPQGKAITKEINDLSLGTLIDEKTGMPLVRSEAELHGKDVKNFLLQRKAEGKITPDEDALLSKLLQEGPEALAKVYSLVAEDPDFREAQANGDQEKMSKIVRNYLGIFPTTAGNLSDALKNQPTEKKKAPKTYSDVKDWLKTIGA